MLDAHQVHPGKQAVLCRPARMAGSTHEEQSTLDGRSMRVLLGVERVWLHQVQHLLVISGRNAGRQCMLCLAA